MSNIQGLIQFGTIVQFKDSKYCSRTVVYITHEPGRYYFAEILPTDKSQMVLKRYNVELQKAFSPMIGNLVLTFIELKTETYNNQIAHLHTTVEDFKIDLLIDRCMVLGELCTSDKQELLITIRSSDAIITQIQKLTEGIEIKVE